MFILMLAGMSAGLGAAEPLKVAVIRVDFQQDDSPATTGDGSFVLEDTVDIDCSDWTIDPAPHNSLYFEDHLLAAHNYWQEVSNGSVTIDLANSTVYPLAQDQAYHLPYDMLYYHPYLEDFDETAKLFELSRDALELADADIDFNLYSTVILVHAGMGGDFAFALDPTPGNIPSAYLGQTDFSDYGQLSTDEKNLADLIIIPESQNFLQYKETRSLFEDSSDPCFYQVGLNGTIALMLGFHIGLPPLYNTETGRSLVGGFALMDQGSNNFHGIVPAYPDPFTRIEAGWVSPDPKHIGDTVMVGISDPPVKVSISDTEYYLFENRQRNRITPPAMTVWIDTIGGDTVSVELSPRGVVINVDERHAGLPGNGLYIWHIDESARATMENPNGGEFQFIDFIEADGAQDMGYATQLLFAEYLETGWWFDPWFAGNEGWFDLNRRQIFTGDSLLHIDTYTNPSTHSNNGIPSHLRIGDISPNGATMSFTIASDRMLDQREFGEVIGWGAACSTLWAYDLGYDKILEINFSDGRFDTTVSSSITVEMLLEDSIDPTVTFRYPWLITNLDNGTRFRHIETGDTHNHFNSYKPYEVTVNGAQVSYLAEDVNGGGVIVYWDIISGQRITTPVIDAPRAKFKTAAGTQFFYSDATVISDPVAVTPIAEIDPLNSVPDKIDVLTWSSSQSSLNITSIPDGSERQISVDEPIQIIPIDADDNGVYEIMLVYQDAIRIINQTGTLWNGSPFQVAEHFGTALIGTFMDSQPSIFLRHEDSYSVYAFDGEMLDRGVLGSVNSEVNNSIGVVDGGLLVLTDQSCLFFENPDFDPERIYWEESRGRQAGDRTVILFGETQSTTANVKQGSVYNYPNPIQGSSTTIRAWIGELDTWRIEIFSMSGAQIAYSEQTVTQVNAYNEWIWDASAISNGVYLAQISAGDQSELIKIAIIR